MLKGLSEKDSVSRKRRKYEKLQQKLAKLREDLEESDQDLEASTSTTGLCQLEQKKIAIVVRRIIFESDNNEDPTFLPGIFNDSVKYLVENEADSDKDPTFLPETSDEEVIGNVQKNENIGAKDPVLLPQIVNDEINKEKNLSQENKGCTIYMIDPVIIESGLQKVNSLKLKDVDKLLTKHFGNTWRTMEELKFFEDIIFNNNQLEQLAVQEGSADTVPDTEKMEEATYNTQSTDTSSATPITDTAQLDTTTALNPALKRGRSEVSTVTNDNSSLDDTVSMPPPISPASHIQQEKPLSKKERNEGQTHQ
ncbi:unnamed protein product [Diabrotica balteata]|uniref:Uncharacterized protein n=1 Tax=Diabrotica balteata TaxID=107213 RepID=A0A9N9TDJ1_DIABA|nr:unnamed protein product [Diabrotica balteata]